MPGLSAPSSQYREGFSPGYGPSPVVPVAPPSAGVASFFFVRDYGALLNANVSTTSLDTAAWAAAVAACYAAGGGLVVCLERVRSRTKNISLPDGVSLWLGPETELILPNDAVDGDCLVRNADFVGGNSNIGVYGGRFLGNAVSHTLGQNITCFQFQNVDGLELHPTYVTGGIAEGAYIGLSQNIRVTGSFVGNGLPTEDGSGLHVDTCSAFLLDVYSEGNGFDGVLIQTCTDGAGRVVAAENHRDGLRLNFSTGVQLAVVSRGNVRGVYVNETNTNCAITGVVTGNTLHGFVANTSTDCTFTGVAQGNGGAAGTYDVYLLASTERIHVNGSVGTVQDDGSDNHYPGGGGDALDLDSIAGSLDAAKLYGTADLTALTVGNASVQGTLRATEVGAYSDPEFDSAPAVGFEGGVARISFSADAATSDTFVGRVASGVFGGLVGTVNRAVELGGSGKDSAYHLERANHTGQESVGALNDFVGHAGGHTWAGAQLFGAVAAFNGVAQPFTVASTGLVTNLNADLLNGQTGPHYENVAYRVGFRPAAFWGAANLTTATGYLSGTCYFLYLGKATGAYTSASVRVRVATAAVATIAWAEVAIFTGAPPAYGGVAEVSRRGYADVSGTFNSIGLKTTGVALSGITKGDDLWLCVGSSAATPFQLRAGLADDLQSGYAQQAVVRPSAAPIPGTTTLSAATLAIPFADVVFT